MTNKSHVAGSHTIGNARCASFRQRLYNQSGNNKPDSTLDPSYAAQLRRKCPTSGGDCEVTEVRSVRLEVGLVFNPSFYNKNKTKITSLLKFHNATLKHKIKPICFKCIQLPQLHILHKIHKLRGFPLASYDH